MIRILLLALPLTLMWIALNSALTVANIVVGYIFSVAILMVIAPRESAYEGKLVHFVNLPKQLFMFFAYAIQLAVDILLSGFDVARRLLTNDISKTTAPDFVRISTNASKEEWLVSALSAHAITITPGSLVVDYELGENDESIMLVHVLDINKWTTEVMQEQQKIRRDKIMGWLGHND